MSLDPSVLATMPTDGAGLATALAEVADRPPADDQQLDLFASSPLAAGDRDKVFSYVRGRGRPPGSSNKSTDDWRNFLLQRVRSPLLFMADLISADPFALAEAIRKSDARDEAAEVSVLAIIQLQRQAAADLAPYLHRKQPIAIDAGEDKPMPTIHQVIVQGVQYFAQGADKAHVLDIEPIPADAEVAGGKSHEPGEQGASD